MESKVQLCGKYSTVMQIVVIVLGVKIPISHNSNYWFQTKSIAYSVKMSSFDTLHGALPWPRCVCVTKASHHHNLGAFELQTFTFRHNSRPYHQKLVHASYVLTSISMHGVLSAVWIAALLYNNCTTRSIAHLWRPESDRKYNITLKALP